ncbi:MAG TPA: ubiquinol oxidase subunit II, partial [Candidatus Saccharimonadales bacterium]|nr:ubiquinol oxidase subunit II [Candidatus Saccharimonadales bacterium]
MSKKKESKYRLVRIIGVGALFLIAAILLGFLLLNGKNIAVLNPQGVIADKQRELILITVGLGLIVIVPVFILLFAFAWKYREGNEKAKYTPNADGNKWIEGLWWGIPIIIIGILSVITWVSSHELDPYKKLDSQVKPINVQVVALQWKWLFIYPDLGIASVNEVRFPEKTPVNFELTADAPMNGFWIPSLGSQVYAMAGMSTKLSLEADKVGAYDGSSSNISGKGYAGMRFKAIATNKQDFAAWSKAVAGADSHLDWAAYSELVKPSENNQVAYYMLHEPQLYNKVIMKYMS